MFFKKLLLLSTMLAMMLLVSCVGTVVDKNAKLGKIDTSPSSDANASFDGIYTATAISHDKIELLFDSADGDPGTLTYEIYINNSPLPIKIGGVSLSLNSAGYYTFTIIGLSLGTTYNFNMRVVVAGSATKALQLDSTKSKSATTFNNETADFMGISSLTLGSGQESINTIIVKWIPATITGTLSANAKDPVAYQITYISTGGPANLNNANYTGDDRVVIQTPATLAATPALNKDSQYKVTGLIPGKTYYFQVRVVHKNFVTYSISDPFYKREANNRYLKLATNSSGSIFDFSSLLSSLVTVTHPPAEDALTNLQVNWIPASGEFYNYRVCFKQIGVAGTAAPIVDNLTDTDLNTILNDTNAADGIACIPKLSSETSYLISGLTTYAYYQVKVLACKDSGCATVNRIKSDLIDTRAIASVAPFSGILSYTNPISESALKNISLNFDSPVTSVGYLNKFKLLCYDPTDLTKYASLPLNTTTSAGVVATIGGNITACDGISTITDLSNLSLVDYGLLITMPLKLPVVDSSRRYCFSLVPSIYSTYLNQEDIPNAIVKCFTPQIKTPTILQFPGRSTCTPNTKTLDLDEWAVPTGGLFSHYVILYREKTTPSSFFDFPAAVAAFNVGNTSIYKSITIEKAHLTFPVNIPSLLPGNTYSVGVLTYLDNAGTKLYSQYNTQIGDCVLPLPKARFDEWVDIFAIGPKEDGLTPPQNQNIVNDPNLGSRNYLLETLDDDGIPVEIALDADGITPKAATDVLAAARLKITTQLGFDGVYGSKDSLVANVNHQYSNSGIVKIAWKDVELFPSTTPETLNSYIASATYEATPAIKANRKYGYKVYRSEDNQLTWVDLTQYSLALNKFQDVNNKGLLHPKAYADQRVRNNANPSNDNLVFFTDYSVKFSGIDGETDRARTYWYKIVPVFNSKEITYDPSTNTQHHIIRVTLPPRNMALVHRMIANRTMCQEMDKTISKIAGAHYSCAYNGLGASGLTTPWTQGNTVYDLGGDLLVDRFELSCPFSRGDKSLTQSTSVFDGTKLEFIGKNTNNVTFVGCHNNTSGYEPGTTPIVPVTEDFNYKQIIPGDCFSSDEPVTASNQTNVCSDTTLNNSSKGYNYPGAPGFDLKTSGLGCTVAENLGPNFSDFTDPLSQINTSNPLHPVQSEFGAVYYDRKGKGNNSAGNGVPSKYMGGSGDLTMTRDGDHNSCTVNLSYVTNDGKYHPRWIATSALFGRLKSGANIVGGDGLYNKKILEIRTNPDLYNTQTDATQVKVTPEAINKYHMTLNSTLARVVTSNSSKLPPLDGMSQRDLAKLCSTYKVEVGVETTSAGFVSLAPAAKKRLFRKKESLVASAWPATYDETKVTTIENGTYEELAGSNNNSCNGAGKTALTGSTNLTNGLKITSLFPQSGRAQPLVMVGSSSQDANSSLINTEKCVSRFGIQDLVGNIKETNADEIFCDYQDDALFLGRATNDLQSIPYDENAQTNFKSTLTVWNKSTPNSGTCSIQEVGSTRASSTFLNGSAFVSVNNYLGLNTSLVKQAHSFDQDAILSARNGADGSFLDFGPAHLAPKLSGQDALSLTNGNSEAYYFNTVIGIPLLCEKGCDPDGSNNDNDNTKIASKTLKAALENGPSGAAAIVKYLGLSSITIDAFPTNNSTITSSGVSVTNSFATYDSDAIGALPVNYVEDYHLGLLPLDATDNYALTYDTLTGSAPATDNPGVLYRSWYNTPRNAILKMYTGGSSNLASGRYSLDVSGYSDETDRSVSFNNGGRCSIMINTED